MATIRWIRCVLAGVGAVAASVLLIAIVVFGYAFSLAFQVHGAPDQASIHAFAQRLAPVWGPVVRVVLTLVAGVWASRGMKSPVLQGVVVGATAAMAGLLLAWPPTLRGGVVFGAVLAAGIAGGVMGSRRVPVSS